MRAVDSPKKWMNEFVLFAVISKKADRTNSFICSFFGRIYGAPICFRFYLTFSTQDFWRGQNIFVYVLQKKIFTLYSNSDRHTSELESVVVSPLNSPPIDETQIHLTLHYFTSSSLIFTHWYNFKFLNSVLSKCSRVITYNKFG